ncbi:MAG: glycosyltransferase family 39 protein, partial [Pyrinomonadaceae bacterium]
YSALAATVTTARINPELFIGSSIRPASRLLVISLSLILLLGLGFRLFQLGAEGLSEDELNKLAAVEDYRAHGLTAANGEHPMLMKAILTLSIVGADHWNSSGWVAGDPGLRISTESALRLPGVILGALVSLLLFLVAAELFGNQIGLLAAAFWAVDPSGIAFSRIAKEDIFLLFFFLLANVFWLRGQRAAEGRAGRPEPYYWATAAAFGAMMASKYLFHFFAISVSYYWIFQSIPATRWRLGPRKWLIFFAIMGLAFLLCNPGILLPGIWREILKFAGEHRIGHDGYEFMGRLYHNQMTLWLRGSPWYFYYVFMGVKLPVLELVAFLIGLVLLFRKRFGDGRFFTLFWLMLWFLPFTVLGGKFTRYFTMALPAVLITAAIGTSAAAQWLSSLASRLSPESSWSRRVPPLISSLVLLLSAVASARAMPHYRLYTNAIGGGATKAGFYFPHDEFYDSSVRDAVSLITVRAGYGVRIGCETPTLVKYYAKLAGREDLNPISLSDREALRGLRPGDFIIIARGRRYFSNDAIVKRLSEAAIPVGTVNLGSVPAIYIYALDEAMVRELDTAIELMSMTSGKRAWHL